MMGLREFVELFDKNEVQTEGCNVNMIIEVPHLFEAFMEYASPEMKLYYEKLTETV